jgi:ferredoxin-NADP reductase
VSDDDARSPAGASVPNALYGNRRDHRDLGIGLLMTALPALARVSALLPVTRELPVERDRTIRLEVAQRIVECADGSVVSFVLQPADGAPLPRWWPGAHLDLHLPSGAMRTYSLCGDHREAGYYRIAVRRLADGGGGSVEVHEKLQVGAAVDVRGPRNAFPFAPPGAGSAASRVRFVAGGIGITPILAMIVAAQARGIDWSLVYAGRDTASMPFLDELASYGDRVVVRTDERDGLPTAATLLAGLDATDAVYCCGPPPMIAVVRDAVRDLDGTELHIERFSAAPVVDGEPFEVELAVSGGVVAVPADVSLLDAVRTGRPQIAYSCQQGFCGTCQVRVMSGQPEHRDSILTDEQRAAGEMLICVSRAAAGSRLVLDL